MKDKKFLLVSMVIVYVTLMLSFYGFQVMEKQATLNMKNSDKKPIYFGATYMTMNNPFFVVINDQIESVIESRGDVLITMDPALSKEKQVEQIQYLIDQDIKVLFVNPLDDEIIKDVLKQCQRKGIIVIAVDTTLREDSDINYTVISDNYQAGVICAKAMMEKHESANIVLLKHSATISGAQRIQGFVDTIAGHDEYQVVASEECEGQLELANPVMNALIDKGTEFDVVMALNDPAALGAMAALQEKGIQNVSVYGVDGTPEIKKLIAEGKEVVTVAQSPIEMGKKAVKIAYELLNGKKYEQSVYRIPVTLITKDTIHGYSLNGWQ